MIIQNIFKAVVAGIAATAVMTGFIAAAPVMGLPPMDIPKMLSMMLGNNITLGWMGHFMIGSTLAVIYALFYSRFPFSGWFKGTFYGLFPWFLAQIMVMPLMGMGFFSGSIIMAGGSLVAHLVYGSVLGFFYRPSSCQCEVSCANC